MKLELLRKDECGRVRKLLVVLSFFFFFLCFIFIIVVVINKMPVGKIGFPYISRCFLPFLWGSPVPIFPKVLLGGVLCFVLFEGVLLYLPVWVLSVCVSVSVAPCSLGL